MSNDERKRPYYDPPKPKTVEPDEVIQGKPGETYTTGNGDKAVLVALFDEAGKLVGFVAKKIGGK